LALFFAARAEEIAVNPRQLVYIALLAPFLALTSYVLATTGLVGFYAEMSRSASTVLSMVDLTI